MGKIGVKQEQELIDINLYDIYFCSKKERKKERKKKGREDG